MPEPAKGRCRGCRRPKALRENGTIPNHDIRIPVSRSAIHDVGRGAVRRRCSGSGKPPLEESTR